MKTDLPTGFNCAECGRYAKFSGWLYAHWDQHTIHTCECGARATLHRGLPVTFTPPAAFRLAAGKELDAYGGKYGFVRFTFEADATFRKRILRQCSKSYPHLKRSNTP